MYTRHIGVIAGLTLGLGLVAGALPAAHADTPSGIPNVPAAGSPEERVAQLWRATRDRIAADTALSLTDQQWVERGKPLVAAWTTLETQLGESATSQVVTAVTRFLNDLYGRPHATPERRAAMRNQARASFGERIQQIESRMH